MNQEDAIRAQANIDDGWPYPDNNSDMREETTDAPACHHLNNSLDPEDCWECFIDSLN